MAIAQWTRKKTAPLKAEIDTLQKRIVDLEGHIAKLSPSKLPIAKAFVAGAVNYAGDVGTHAGGSWQRKDWLGPAAREDCPALVSKGATRANAAKLA